MRIPHDVSNLLVTNIDSAAVFVLVVYLVLLVMGFFLEALAMTLIMAPVLYPALMPLGLDPIWFGVVFVIMLATNALLYLASEARRSTSRSSSDGVSNL